MANMQGICSEDQFWTCVEELGWSDDPPHRFYEQVKSRLVREWDDEFIQSFRDHLSKFVGNLYTRVTDFESRNGVSCGCGDDGFSDLLNHIVGLGKEEYEAVMENPNLAVERGQAYKYEESFSYCIPYRGTRKMSFEEALEKAKEQQDRYGHDEDETEEERAIELEIAALRIQLGDAAETSPRLYSALAKRYLPTFKHLLQSEFAQELAPGLLEVIMVFEEVAEGKVGALFDDPDFLDKVRAVHAKGQELYERELRRIQKLRSIGYGPENLVSDARQYLK